MKRNYEKEAEKFVELYEKEIGHKTWKPKKKIGCDLISSGGYYIEVKSWNKPKPPSFIEVYETIFEHLNKTKKKESAYYIYIVYDFLHGPKLIRIPPSKQKWNRLKIRILKGSSYKNIKPINISKYKKRVME